MPKGNICVVLPSPVAYTETFLQAHIEKMSAAVNYLQNFPIDIADVFSSQTCSPKTEQLKQRLRVSWHRCLLNPLKEISLRKFFKTNHVRVVLAEYGLTGTGTLKLCKELNMPLVVHFHGYDAYSNEVLNLYQDRYKKMFHYAAAIIGVSKHMMGQLVSLGAPRDKLFYNPYGVDVSKFKQAFPGRSPPQVIAVGRFVEKKAPYLTILAFRKVLERIPEARLVMVGHGALYDVCHQIVKSLNMEHAVDLKGMVNHDQVATLMRQSRVFVQHSLVPMSADSEGLPNSILEAGASGLPIVSTRHGGIADVVIHGKTGFLVEERDIDAMADYVHKLLSSPALASEMGDNARGHIAQNFNVEGSIKTLKHILESSS